MISEPHKVKTVRRVRFTSQEERRGWLQAVSWNTFRIPSDRVTFDMTSQGTSAMSHDQLAGMLIGDEAYAGSRSFLQLVSSAKEILGHSCICPTHNLRGSIKLISTTMVSDGDKVLANSFMPRELTEERGAVVRCVHRQESSPFSGDLDPDLVRSELDGSQRVPYLYVETFADGYRPISLANLREIRTIADERQCKIVLDASRIVENALFIRENETGLSDRPLAAIVREMVAISHICFLDAGQDPRCNVGGLISTDDPKSHEIFQNEVVVYEGLHTYGGMTGRAMEVFTRGLREMVYENQARWISEQVARFASLLRVPLTIGGDGVYLHADEILPHIEHQPAHALAAALYLKSGVRTFLDGRFADERILPLQIPRLALNDRQLSEIARAINELYDERGQITGFELTNEPDWNDEAEFAWSPPDLGPHRFDCEPHVIHTFEYIGITSREQRERANKESGYNTFLLMSEDVGIDLLTDSGTCAMSVDQWQAYEGGVETSASSKDYFDFVEAVRDITGYEYVMPTHQGRAAEHILSQLMIHGRFVPGNMYFTTTKLHQEMAGGAFADIIVDEAHDTSSKFEWKGNIDLTKLDALVVEHGADSIHYVSFEMSVNMAGGQPFSLDNAREVYAYCQKHGIPLMFDATRAAENSYMIKKRDPRYHDVPAKEILQQIFRCGDGVTWSSKKDALVNIGGFQAFRSDEGLYKRALAMLRKYEGSVTSGGMSAGDMAAQAQGIREMVDDDYIRARVEQTQYLGNRLIEAGVPIVEPPGGHAIFLDARRFLPHIDADEFPAQALAAAIYVECGVRTMERGNVSKGRNPKTGENYRPPLELVRVTIPRRTYTNSHMDTVADGIIAVFKRRREIKGLHFTYEPPVLRFFQSRFEEVNRSTADAVC